MHRYGLVFALALVGCSNSIAGVRSEHASGGGTARIYAVPAARAYSTSAEILRREGIQTLEEHQAEGYMLGHKEPSVLPVVYGAYVGVWIEPSGADHSKVTVVAKREHPGDMITGLSEDGFQDELGKALAVAPATP